MISFELLSQMGTAQLRVNRKAGSEVIQVERPFYKDVLEVDWLTTHYKIVRSGLLRRDAKIYKEGEYLGKIEEQLGFMTHFDVYHKAKKLLAFHEHETITKQEFRVLKNGKDVGLIRPMGVYVPILSNIGKGVHGEYWELTKEEEELLLLAIIAVGV